ncbi:glycosyltransferase [Candidatus Parcubacteria bacterium]|nr:MAG: glycosyltransferase [Candidatus Parcubacteria bacterium]
MDALLITSDTEVLRERSDAQERVKAYGALGKHIVVFVLHTQKAAPPPWRASQTVWIMPIYGPILPIAAYNAMHAARRELYFQKKFQVEIIDAGDAYFSAFAAWLIAHTFKRPLHITALEFDRVAEARRASRFSALLWPVSHFLLTRADSVSTDAEAVRDALIRVDPSWKDRVTMLARSVDIQVEYTGSAAAPGAPSAQSGEADLRARYPQYKIILLTVAPFTPEYNLQLAIRVLAGVLQTYKFAGLVMVGEGSEERALRALARKMGIEGHVAFEKWTPELASYYKTAHIFLVTAPEKEYRNTIADAANASCTIISTHVGLAAEFLKSEESGYFCDVNDIECFVRTADMLIKNPAVRERVRLNGMLAFQGYMAQNEPAGQEGDARQKTWEIAQQHFAAVQTATKKPPKVGPAITEKPTK